jgi:hypothetical protein
MKILPVMIFAVGALFSFHVQAANEVSVQLPIDQTDIDSALATARTPQEAARTFAKLVASWLKLINIEKIDSSESPASPHRVFDIVVSCE